MNKCVSRALPNYPGPLESTVKHTYTFWGSHGMQQTRSSSDFEVAATCTKADPLKATASLSASETFLDSRVSDLFGRILLWKNPILSH